MSQSTTQLSPIQENLLETLKAFDNFCKAHDLKYFAASGTLLGAVRHKGFIPWDDDIDVYMLREDYDRILSLKDELANTSHYAVSDFRDNNYPYPFAKFYSKQSTFWEYKHFPFILGAFIDIFPIDNWDNNNADHIKLFKTNAAINWNYRKSVSVQTWKEIFSDIIHFNGVEGYIKLVKQLIYRPQRKRLYNKLIKLDKEISSVQGPELKGFWDNLKIFFNKDLFSSQLEMPFENTTIPVPVGYHEVLTCLYGDYMTPPAEHHRTGHHTAYFMDLNKRYTIEEIMRLKKEEAPSQPKSMKLSVLINELKLRFRH